MNEESPILDSSFETSFTSRDYKSIENISTDYGKSINDLASHTSSGNTLRRNMKFKHGFAFLVGAVIGAGIFITPSLVARRTSNLFLTFVAWILAGGMALLGTLCYCEMVSVVQKTGGSYIFILDCYGKASGFFVNWTNAMIFAPCGTYFLLLTFGLYSCAPFFKDHDSAEYLWCSKLVGIFVMLIIVIINCLGSKKSAVFQICFISVQMVVITVILSLGIYSAATTNSIHNLSPAVVFNNTVEGLTKDLPSFGIALFNAIYCFDGYATIAYIVEEVENPSQTIPLIAFTSIPFVSFLYLIINLACGAALTYSEMGSSNIVVSKLAGKVGGDTFVYFVSFFVAISVVPALSAVFYNLPRLIMSSAREEQFPSVFALIHKERRTPIPAICFLAVMTTIVTLIDLDMETLIQCCNISIWFEYAFAFSTILVNRYKRPHLHRTYKTWITTPICMIIIPAIMLVLAVVEKPLSTLCIVLFMMLGMPIYYNIGTLSFIFIVVLVSNSGFTSAAGTTPNLKELFIGRCLNYQEILPNGQNPLLEVNVDCDDLWNAFNDSLAYRDPCSITENSYYDFFKLADNGVRIADKLMFWSGTYEFTKKLTFVNSDYIAVADTFPGFLVDSLEWCTAPNSSDGYSMTEDCQEDCDPSTPFWTVSSENFARIAKGTVYVMLNSKYETPYRDGSFFQTIELPTLNNNPDVNKLVVYMLTELDSEPLALCDSENIKQLKHDASGIDQYECYNNPPVFQFLMCAENPDHEKCNKAANDFNKAELSIWRRIKVESRRYFGYWKNLFSR